jgi:hypothetical protein
MSRVVRAFTGTAAGGVVGRVVATLFDMLQFHHANLPDDVARFGLIGIGTFNGLAIGLWGWWKTM